MTLTCEIVMPDAALHPKSEPLLVYPAPPEVACHREHLPMIRKSLLVAFARALTLGPKSVSLNSVNQTRAPQDRGGGGWRKGPSAMSINLAIGSEFPERDFLFTQIEVQAAQTLMSDHDMGLFRQWRSSLVDTCRVVVQTFDDKLTVDLDDLLFAHETNPEGISQSTVRKLRMVRSMTYPLYRHGHLTPHGVLMSRLFWLILQLRDGREAELREMMRLATAE